MKKILLMAFLVLASTSGTLAQSKKTVRVRPQTELSKTKTPATSSRKTVKQGMMPSSNIPKIKGNLIPSAKTKPYATQKVVSRKTNTVAPQSKPFKSEQQLGGRSK